MAVFKKQTAHAFLNTLSFENILLCPEIFPLRGFIQFQYDFILISTSAKTLLPNKTVTCAASGLKSLQNIPFTTVTNSVNPR